jgi:transcriptional regulator with XRE-family HTH domain
MTPEQARQFGAYLRQHRETARLSMRGLAAKAGLDIRVISMLEHGDVLRPKADTLRALALALGLPVAELYAASDYLTADDLPTPAPYLRTKYPDLPDEAIEQIDRYLTRLMRRHGVDPAGPAPGEDER